MKIKLKDVRLAFPALFQAKTVNGEGEPAFSAAFIFPVGHSAEIELKAAIDKVGQEKWGAKWSAIKLAMEKADKTCIHDGDTKGEYDGYAGNLFVSSRNKTKPLVIDRDKTELSSASGKPYAGCYVNASIELWAQDNNYGKRINASLRGVQFFRDGDAFAGGGAASDDEFDDVAEGADADELV